jgi:hypothetical protein
VVHFISRWTAKVTSLSINFSTQTLTPATTESIIVFCPPFWSDQIPYLHTRTEKKSDKGRIGPNMNVVRETKEHILLHEYMHADEAEFWSEPEKGFAEHSTLSGISHISAKGSL